jgi:peroxiredoxin
MRIGVGQKIGRFVWHTSAGTTTTIPDAGGSLVNLQFSRWAGCPICNMHLASFRSRAREIEDAGVKVVVVFHSPEEDVIELRGDIPFALIPDPDKRYYRAFGVEQSAFFLMSKKAFASLRREAKQGHRAQRIRGGVLGLPASFIIDKNGAVLAAHYGRHADDNLGVDDVLRIARSEGRSSVMGAADDYRSNPEPS